MALGAKIADRIEAIFYRNMRKTSCLWISGFPFCPARSNFRPIIAGRQYIPFGNFDSHFVTDPLTLLLGETNEGALVGGYRPGGETVDICLSSAMILPVTEPS